MSTNTNESGRLDVVAVGGAGGMGRWAVRALAKLGSAKRIRIADINGDAATRFAAEIGDIAQPVVLDATDKQQMAEVFSDADVVLNTMGPFAKFGTPILKAAIEAGCDYLDIDDDWQSTIEALDLDDYVRAQGRRVVIGLGASPGISNLLTSLAARKLDHVDQLLTGWSISDAVIEDDPNYPATGGSAATQHWLLQCSGTINAWVDGELKQIKPLKRVDFNFPGLGSRHGWTMGHPEPLTLPRAFPGVSLSLNVQTAPDEMMGVLKQFVEAYERGEISLDSASIHDSQMSAAGAEAGETGKTIPGVWGFAHGTRDGKELNVAAYLKEEDTVPAKMGGMTGIPLAVGVELLRRGKVKPGVNAPEKAISPEDFFALFIEYLGESDDFVVIKEEPGEAPELS